MRVEVEQAAVAVGRGAVVGAAESVDRLAHVRVAPEEVAEAAVVDPVLPDLELCHRRRPVREVELPLTEARRPGREAEVGQLNLPLLERPVGSVGSLAGGDHPRQRGAVVRRAGVPEVLPVELVVLAPASRVVELETHLLERAVRLPRIDRAPGEDVLRLAAHGPVGDEGLALAVHREPDVADVAVDQLGGGRRRRKRRDEGEDREERQQTSTHEGDPFPRQMRPHSHAIGCCLARPIPRFGG